MDIQSFFRMNYGLYIVGARDGEKQAGCVANTLVQVCNAPNKFTITLNKDSYTKELIDQSGYFNAVVLCQDVDMKVIGVFGFQSSKNMDKFEQFEHLYDSQGIPYISEHVNAYFLCKVIHQVDLDTHVMFIGEVKEAEILSAEESMSYTYYQQVKNGETPENAPSYQAKPKRSGWRCVICGYIYEGEELPADYICPLCDAPASAFEKI